MFSLGITSSSLWSHITSASLIVDRMQQLRNQSFYSRKPHTFWWSATLLGTPKRRLGRGYTARSDLLAVQNPFCGRPLCSTSASRASISCTLRSKLPLVVPMVPLKRLHCRCYAKHRESFVLPAENTHLLMVSGSSWHLITEVRSRYGCTAGPFWLSLIHI